MTPSTLNPLLLLAELAEAATGGTTRTSTARRAALALARHLPLRALEIAWHHPADAQVDVVSALINRRDVEVRQHARPPSTAAPGGPPGGPRPSGWPRDVLTTLSVPLEDEEQRGWALLGLSAASVPGLSDPLLEAIARVLCAAERHLLLIERVASVSRRAFKENLDLRRRLERAGAPSAIVAVSAAMRDILRMVELVAPYTSTVLIRGESGTGKELIARRIHAISPRADRPFVQVNCGALPHELIESELFGHERGAFTGAEGRHVGRFERAHGGTLLLDEIGELSLHAQVKLLRVLQEGELERVGGEQNVKIDVRVIAATHRDLEAMVRDGLFRADLYYRLNVFPLRIPPLRERPEDIPALVEHLTRTIAQRLGRHAPQLPAEALAALCRAPWPGNVRELENLLERALILSPTEHLVLPGPMPLGSAADALHPPTTTIPTLDESTRAAIAQALLHTRGRIYGADGAAALLGLPPSTLQSKMARLGLRRDDFTGPALP